MQLEESYHETRDYDITFHPFLKTINRGANWITEIDLNCPQVETVESNKIPCALADFSNLKTYEMTKD